MNVVKEKLNDQVRESLIGALKDEIKKLDISKLEQKKVLKQPSDANIDRNFDSF